MTKVIYQGCRIFASHILNLAIKILHEYRQKQMKSFQLVQKYDLFLASPLRLMQNISTKAFMFYSPMTYLKNLITIDQTKCIIQNYSRSS